MKKYKAPKKPTPPLEIPMPKVKPPKPEHAEPFDLSVITEFEPHCKGCTNIVLDVTTSKMHSNDALLYVGVKLCCNNAKQYKQLAKHFEEEQNGKN